MNNSTVVFPLPLDVLAPFTAAAGAPRPGEEASGDGTAPPPGELPEGAAPAVLAEREGEPRFVS